MTDNDKPLVSDAPEPIPAAPETAPLGAGPAAAPPSRRGSALGGLALLLLVLAGAGGSFWLWQQLQWQEVQLQAMQAQTADSAEQIVALQSRVQAQVNDHLASAQAREQDLRQQLSTLQKDQDQLRQQVDGHQQRLTSLATTSREDWLLAEAEYLLNIANQRVLMERTADNAAALLRSADERLQQVSDGTGDAELFAIRKALNRDLTALEKIPPLDKEGIYLRLYALAENVDDLPRLQIDAFATGSDSAAAPDATDAPPTGWAGRLWHGLRSLVGSLDRYVRIDDVEAPAKPLIDSYATRLAALNVRLLLEQAQLALLQEEPTVYRHSLEKAQTLLQSYYVDSEQNTRLRASLAELTDLEVAQELPDISTSLTLLRDYLRQLHRVQPAPKGQL